MTQTPRMPASTLRRVPADPVDPAAGSTCVIARGLLLERARTSAGGTDKRAPDRTSRMEDTAAA